MIGQQRQILTDLGIDLWIPREIACQNLTPNSIWRDQGQDQEQMLPIADLAETIHVPEPSQVVAPVVVPPVKAEIAPSHAQAKLEVQVTQAVAIDAKQFELQLLCLAHCVIVIDATALSVEAKQLWSNIHVALAAEYQQLNWPLPLLNWQDAHGASSYIQGFLNAHGMDKQIIGLGALPCAPEKMLTLASLDEMLIQPILKKQLWHYIQNKK